MAGKKVTGRTKQLSLKSTPEFHQRLKVLAKNTIPKASQDEVPQKRVEKRPLPNEETETSSKKRKISE
nr:4662_t:CDS:2 [Entrophospora candida]